LNGKSYSCKVEVIEKVILNQETTCSNDDNEEGRNNECISESQETLKEYVLAEFPCAPALFGPTHISNLDPADSLFAEAAIHVPALGDEFGCKRSQFNCDANPPFHDLSRSESEQSLRPSTSRNIPHEFTMNAEFEGQFCNKKVVSFVRRGSCTFQEKSMNQKINVNAEAVVVINTEDDELFVMSGGRGQDVDGPVTVLIAGSDGQAILNTIKSFDRSETSQLHARVSLIRDETDISQSDSGISVNGNQFWPGVIASTEAIQIFSPYGWGVHALQRSSSSNSEETEWQLFLLTHDTIKGV
jgi:hypothetical protein